MLQITVSPIDWKSQYIYKKLRVRSNVLFFLSTVHKIVRVVAIRSIVTSGSLGKAPSDSTPPTKDVGGNTPTAGGPGSGGTGSGKKNTLTCPKCGDPCTHVETFVCEYFLV